MLDIVEASEGRKEGVAVKLRRKTNHEPLVAGFGAPVPGSEVPGHARSSVRVQPQCIVYNFGRGVGRKREDVTH